MITTLHSLTKDAPGPATTPTGEAKLITVASGKGGVGKTWVSATLTHALAREGRNALLFDGDLGLANVDIQLGLMPSVDLGAVFQGRCALEDAVIPVMSEAGRPLFHVIAGKSGSGAFASLRPDAITALKAELAEVAFDYDGIVVDLAAGIDNNVIGLADHGGRVIVVVTPDPTSITDAYAFIKILAMRRTGARIHVVVNMASDRTEGKRAYETLRRAAESFLKISPPLLGIIRHDRLVRDAIRHQTPFLIRHPASPAAEDVIAIARKLLAETGPKV
ncbi:MAG: MinD/ParA family protein [Sphingomonadales bacterium]